MGAHDGRGLGANGLGHAVDLRVGLLDELGNGSLVALLLGLGVGRSVRREGQVGLHSHTGDTDADAVGCVNTFVHILAP